MDQYVEQTNARITLRDRHQLRLYIHIIAQNVSSEMFENTYWMLRNLLNYLNTAAQNIAINNNNNNCVVYCIVLINVGKSHISYGYNKIAVFVIVLLYIDNY